jgi:serine/threonine-protein kinase
VSHRTPQARVRVRVRGPIFAAALFASTISAVVPSAHAQANDAAAAQALFDEGKRLMTAGRHEAACAKFAESQRLDPGVGTLLWLADCNAKSGRTASAWALFNEAESLAIKQQDTRASVAHEEAAKLAPKLSKLTIDASLVVDLPGLEIKRDGVTLGRPIWGTPTPTDAGVHRISASAPGKKTWESGITVPPDGASAAIQIPRLEQAPLPKSSELARADVGGSGGNQGRGQRIFGAAVIGVGVVGAAIGTYFGLSVGSKNDDSNAHCNASSVCDQRGFDLRHDALGAATVSDIAFIVAAVALVSGTVLVLTAPKAAPKTGFGTLRFAASPGRGGATSWSW